MPTRKEPILLALGVIWISTGATIAQDNCDRITLVADEFYYDSPTDAISEVLPELQSRFDAAFQEICEVVENDPLEWVPSDELVLLNRPGANQMGIYIGEDEEAAALEYPFEIEEGVLSELPPTEEFRRAIICVSGSEEQFQLDPVECLPD